MLSRLHASFRFNLPAGRPACRRIGTMLLVALLGLGPRGGAAAADLSRVIVAGGSITEILYALHLEDHIAALDSTSLFPPAALRSKPKIGYVRALSAEGLLAQNPSLVLAIDGAGPPAALDLVRSAGVAVVTVPDEASVEGIGRKIEAIGRLFGADAAAQALEGDVTARFAALAVARARVTKPRRVLFVLSLQNGRSMVGGTRTAADGIIGLAGALNAAAAIDGYKPMSDEAILAAEPDVILTMQNAGSPIAADVLFANPAFAGTPAGQARALVALDGLLLLGFGPRTPDAAVSLMQAVYPDLTIPRP